MSLHEGLPRAYVHSGNWSCNSGDPYGATGYRLPTDAEWECAAQYDDERMYPWGDQDHNCNLANADQCVGWTTDVGSYPAGNSALGLSDMVGNLREWCQDRWESGLGTDPATDPVVDPQAPPYSTSRVYHGGAYGDGDGSCARSSRLSHPRI